MTKPDGEFGETLRRALDAATGVEPTDDALERIRARARVRTPRRRLAAFLAVIVPWRVYRLLQYRTMAGDLLRAWTAATRTRLGRARQRFSGLSAFSGSEKNADKPENQPRHADTAAALSSIGWLRPALAAAAVAFVATLAVTVGPVRQAIVQIGSSVMSSGHGQADTGTGTLSGDGKKVNAVPASTRAASSSANDKSSTATPVSSPSPCVSATHASGKASSCPSPSASPSATTSPKTSPSATASSSPTSPATGSPAPSSPAASATPSASDTGDTASALPKSFDFRVLSRTKLKTFRAG